MGTLEDYDSVGGSVGLICIVPCITTLFIRPEICWSGLKAMIISKKALFIKCSFEFMPVPVSRQLSHQRLAKVKVPKITTFVQLNPAP